MGLAHFFGTFLEILFASFLHPNINQYIKCFGICGCRRHVINPLNYLIQPELNFWMTYLFDYSLLPSYLRILCLCTLHITALFHRAFFHRYFLSSLANHVFWGVALERGPKGGVGFSSLQLVVYSV